MYWQDPEHLVRRIDAHKRDRQARIAEAKAAHEYSELLDCTFTPAITRKVPQPTGPVVVRGLERYMELQVDMHHPAPSQRHLSIGQSMTFVFCVTSQMPFLSTSCR